MADIFHLVGFRPFDRMALRREERREAKHIPGTRRAVRAVAGRPQVSHADAVYAFLPDERLARSFISSYRCLFFLLQLADWCFILPWGSCWLVDTVSSGGCSKG